MHTQPHRYWPEFAANGKADMTVRVAASHRGGLFSNADLTLYDSMDFVRHMNVIAAQPSEPLGEGFTSSYHALTMGIIMGGIVYKVTGLTPDAFLQKHIAQPLGLDLFCGRPKAPHIAARVTEKRTMAMSTTPPPPEIMAEITKMFSPGSNFQRALFMHKDGLINLTNPRAFEDQDDDVTAARVENTSYACFTNARSLARMYAAMLWELDGVRLLSDKTVAIVSKPEVLGRDETMPVLNNVGWGPTGFLGPTFPPGPITFLGPLAEGFKIGDVATYGYFKVC
jgi:CubicO group peptidase (beta-lactamase class C family)